MSQVPKWEQEESRLEIGADGAGAPRARRPVHPTTEGDLEDTGPRSGHLVLQLGSSPHIGAESSTAPGLQAGFLLQCESLGDSTRVTKILINIHMHTYT